jgi:hypothetical protein
LLPQAQLCIDLGIILKNSFIIFPLLLEKAHEEDVCEMAQSSSLDTSDNRGPFLTIRDNEGCESKDIMLQPMNRIRIRTLFWAKKTKGDELYGRINESA